MSGLRFQSASQVFDAFPEMHEDMVAQAADMSPLVYVQHLENSASPEDAITFCAHVLDRRKAVWWALGCVRHLAPPQTREEEIAIKTAEVWVREPEEYRRVAALGIGMKGRRDLAGTWVALAAGGSGGTMTSGNLPGPPVPPNLCARAVRTAILVALSAKPARERKAHLTGCVQMFRDLAKSEQG